MIADSAPMHTIALVSAFPLHTGGVETHLLSLMRRSDGSRDRWCILAPASAEFAARAAATGAKVIPWQPAHVLDGMALLRLVQALRQCRADLIHVHDPRGAIFARIAARLLRIPIVVTVHLPPYYYVTGASSAAHAKRRLYRGVERFFNRYLTAKLIYVSGRAYDEARAMNLLPPGRAEVIENGIDLSLYAAGDPSLREEMAVPEGAAVICFVGRLDVQKGADVLLEAAARLKRSGKVWRLWLAGDGPQRADLEVQARRLGLDQTVQFLGYRDDAPRLLMASDLFVLPSRYEAMPMSVLESMAAGVPAVVTDVGENARLVEDQVTGVVVLPENVEALADALRLLLDDPARRTQMGAAARDRAQRYSDFRMARRILDVYDSLLGHKSESGGT